MALAAALFWFSGAAFAEDVKPALAASRAASRNRLVPLAERAGLRQWHQTFHRDRLWRHYLALLGKTFRSKTSGRAWRPLGIF